MSEGEQQRRRVRGKRASKASVRRRNAQSQRADSPSPAAGPSSAAPAAEAAEQPLASPESRPPFPIVGIGASAGGLAAFEQFFAALPDDDDTGMAFVLVQHLAPDHKSILVDLVKRYTKMQVFEAEDRMPVQPHCTYIIPPNHDLTLVAGVLFLARHADRHRPPLTIDHFFNSLAAAQRDRAICIIMSGTGTDGTLGLRAIKGEGGLVIVQTPETTEYDGMPRSAIATGVVDYVLAPAEMPSQLIAYARHAFDPSRQPPPPPARDGMLKKICMLLRAQTGHDFSQYKQSTLVRRIERRMALHQLSEPEQYVEYASRHFPEIQALFRDLLIGVTQFFRDAEAFDALDKVAIPQIVASKSQDDAVRVWVCGCATGEEAYSIAMLLYEQMTAARNVFKMQIFATDIDRLAIEQARVGVYPASIAADISEERLARFFVHDAEQGIYRVQKYLRDLLVFSEQDVIKDPPFSRIDLLSCRNMLIYMTPELQRRLIALFHYALVPGGVLFLGNSETTTDGARKFQPVNRKAKLFVRLENDTDRRQLPRVHVPDFVPPASEGGERRARNVRTDAAAGPGDLRLIAERALLAHYAQAGVLVNARGDILHIVGRTGKFLEPADGDAAMNIVSMAREGLRRELTVGLHNVVSQRRIVTYPGLNVKANGGFIAANLTLRPIEAGDATIYLVILEEAQARSDVSQAANGDQAPDARVAELERELRWKEEYLQTTLEEMETTNEELKSTNEEMQSINEELQSTNEELETSKEELQSVNEELSTVNAELHDKVNELSRANNDMNNLLAGTGIATLFVDHDLNIARFTPAATQVVNLIASDVGRPLAHVADNLIDYPHLVEDIRAVLETLVPKEAEVQVKGRTWYLMRIRPYKTIENVIEGAVVTLVDISERKKAEALVAASEARLTSIFDQANAGVAQADLQGYLQFVNTRFCELLGYDREELSRLRLGAITDSADLARVQRQYDAIVNDGSRAEIDKRYVRKDGSRLAVHERVSVIRDADGKPELLLLTFEAVAGEDAMQS